MIASQLLLASSFTSNQPTQLQALLRQVYANGREGSVFSTDPELVGTYQDWTGSTPVSDVEQDVGLQLDSRFELVRGAEFVCEFPRRQSNEYGRTLVRQRLWLNTAITIAYTTINSGPMGNLA